MDSGDKEKKAVVKKPTITMYRPTYVSDASGSRGIPYSDMLQGLALGTIDRTPQKRDIRVTVVNPIVEAEIRV